MTEQTAQKVANVALGAAALGATYVIARTPRLRRMAIGLAMTALTSAIPGPMEPCPCWTLQAHAERSSTPPFGWPRARAGRA
jgi:hypothetical protein